jgi:hypothetical protein
MACATVRREWERSLPVDQIITGGLLAMGGAVASQAAGILTLVNSGRRRGQEAVSKRAVEREATRRQLYQELLTTIEDARLHCAEISEASGRLNPGKPSLSGLTVGVPERFEPLRTVAVAVMIDGSARASQTATAISGTLREFTQAWKAAVKKSDAKGLDLMASRLTDLTDLLGKAEREVVMAARADFGVPN